MKIGIDISQTAYSQTGVSNYLSRLVEEMVNIDNDNEYILFYSSLRKKISFGSTAFNLQTKNNVTVKAYKFPPMLLDVVWNRFHIAPIEWFIGDVDVFITSDWTEPPTKKAKKITILYDLIILAYPTEMNNKIIKTQKRKLAWVVKESQKVLCISNATKNDAEKLLQIPEERLEVLYPGL